MKSGGDSDSIHDTSEISNFKFEIPDVKSAIIGGILINMSGE
jgi:hypothetical protein